MASILLIGGTVFLGRHLAEAALNAGHSLTLLTRGLTQRHLFPEARHIHADRDIGPLPDDSYDAVFDTCGFVPRVVKKTLALRWKRYLYVSSVSAYANLSVPNDENAPTLPNPPDENVEQHYGALKAACEREVLLRGGTVIRPGLIGGPHDPTGRFTYWPLRLAEGGRVLAPMPKEAPIQVIDARDLASFLLKLMEEDAGVYNAVGEEIPFQTALMRIGSAVGGQFELVWRNPEVEPWNELPLWVGPEGPSGMMRTSNARAKAAGLQLRPIEETARDTLAWSRSLSGEPPRQVDGRYRPRTLEREKKG